MIFAEMHLVTIIRSIRAGPATALTLEGEISVEAHLSPGWVFRYFWFIATLLIG